jgi:phosphatidylglycerophosphate synthase
MNATDWRLPDAPLRASAVTSKLLGLVMVFALASVARASLPLGDLYPLKASALFAAIMLLSIGFLQRHHPFARFGPANQITTVRAMLVTLVASLVGEPRLPGVAAGAVAASVAVTVLDGVDGWLARRNRIASDFGARFDLEVDALLILALSVLVWRGEKAGAWVVVSGLLRYAFVAAGWLWPWVSRPLPPSRRRQTVCVVQIAGLCAAVSPIFPAGASAPVAAVSLAALAASFLVDVVWLWRARPTSARAPAFPSSS